MSLTGIQDAALLTKGDVASVLRELRAYAQSVNEEYSRLLGINPATAITTVKPSGTVSQLVNSSSGIHGRFAPFYLRSVRQSNNDPLTALLKAQGVPNEPDRMNPARTTVFYFPIKSPEGAVLASDQTAIEQLENWKLFQDNWAEHSVSVTVYVKEHEWLAVGDWVYQNFDSITGVSFLPYSDHVYEQAPYTEITEEEYNERVAAFPQVEFSELVLYEQEDNTEGSQTLACVAGGCEI